LKSRSRREDLIEVVANRIELASSSLVTRVAIDGIDGAGKTVFADEMAAALSRRGRSVIRASVDGFHNPRQIRYRLGRRSPEGYFRDSYDYAGLQRLLLEPLGPGGSGKYRAAAFDHRTDSAVNAPEERAPAGAILVFDGIFLHRPELRGSWNFSVFLAVDFPVSIARCAVRDGALPADLADGNRRYVEGQKLYLTECEPTRYASVVIDNNDLAAPFVVQ